MHAAFDKGAAPAWLAPLGALKGYKDPPSAHRFRVPLEGHGILLTGAPDAVYERMDGTLVIADYKTSRYTDGQEKLLPVYRVQLNAYAFIARKLGWNPVSALALIYTEPVTHDGAAAAGASEDGFSMGFSAKIVPVEHDEGMLEPLFTRAIQIYSSEKPPRPQNNCADCARLDAIRGLLR